MTLSSPFSTASRSFEICAAWPCFIFAGEDLPNNRGELYTVMLGGENELDLRQVRLVLFSGTARRYCAQVVEVQAQVGLKTVRQWRRTGTVPPSSNSAHVFPITREIPKPSSKSSTSMTTEVGGHHDTGQRVMPSFPFLGRT